MVAFRCAATEDLDRTGGSRPIFPVRLPDIGPNDRRVWATVLLSRAEMGRRLPVLRCPGTGEFAGYSIAEFSWSTRSPNILIRLLANLVR